LKLAPNIDDIDEDRMTRLLCTFLLLPALLLAALPSAAQQPGSGYRYTAPPGWSRSADGDVEVFAPQSEPEGTAQLLVLAPKAASGDFRAQFDTERQTLEQFWGLRAPQAVPLQSGQAPVGRYAAYFASYDSEGGARYMGFMALGSTQNFGMLVFVAASHDAFNRLAPRAVEVFKSLSLAQ
jgi:hypothetical protein